MSRIIMLALLGFFTSCNQHSNSTPPPEPAPAVPVTYPKDNFKVGEVIPSIPLHMDAAESFALYLPKGYTDTSKLPAIIFFDPHGDGTVPLNLYHDLADEYHYVLIGSNTSRNGIPLDQTQAIAVNLFSESKSRISINPSKITYCGFSGGAKVALLSGASNPEIANIIYAGAKVDITPNHTIALLGFAGLRDMNYSDLVMFERETLAKLPFKHYLIEWKGKHEFPTADVFRDAFIFLNTGTVENYNKKQVTITSDQLKAEQDKKNEYIKAFQGQDLAWWKKEIADLNSKKKTNIMDERLLGFLSLACYSIGGGQLQENNLDVAEKILSIYKLADPENKDCDGAKPKENCRACKVNEWHLVYLYRGKANYLCHWWGFILSVYRLEKIAGRKTCAQATATNRNARKHATKTCKTNI